MKNTQRMKTPKLVITFSTTTAAMAMEAACGPGKGRLIPIPKEVSGGCGLAWCAEPDMEEALAALMEAHHIPCQEKHIINLY